MYPPSETNIRKPSALDGGRKLDMASRTLPRLLLISHFGISQVWFSKCLCIPSRYIRIGCAFPALSCVSGTPFPPNSRSLGRTSWSSSQVAAPSLRIFLGSLGRAWLQCASHVKSNQSKYQRTSSRFSPLEILYSTVFCHVPLSNRFFLLHPSQACQVLQLVGLLTCPILYNKKIGLSI